MNDDCVVVVVVAKHLCWCHMVARQEKERKKAEAAQRAAEKAAQGRLPPGEMFRQEADKYSQFDDKVYKLYTFATRKYSRFHDKVHLYATVAITWCLYIFRACRHTTRTASS